MTYRQDAVFQTVQWLRSGNQPETFVGAFVDAWSRWARVRPGEVKVRLGLINYKPFERARVMADVTFVPGRRGSMPVTLNLFLHIFADADMMRREFEAAAAEKLVCCYGPPVFRLDSRNLVAWTLPNAPNLAELKELLDPEGFRRLLCRSSELAFEGPSTKGPTLVRYVPLKRAILTWNGPASGKRYYVKLIDGPAAATAVLNLRELDARARHRELSFAVPRPVYYNPDLHTIIMSEVTGQQFSGLMSEGVSEAFGDVGDALASLHRLKTSPPGSWTPERELRDLRRHMDGVKCALPNLASRIDSLLARLERPPVFPASSYTPIHGNLFGDQILYDHAAKDQRVGIVDWDAWALGDPHFDLGRLIAHFTYIARIANLSGTKVAACIHALLRSYENAGGIGIDRINLEWQVAVSVLVRAKISSLRKLRPGWPRHIELMVTEAERILGGDGIASCETSYVPRRASGRASVIAVA